MPSHDAPGGVRWAKPPLRYSSYSIADCGSVLSVDGVHLRIRLPQLSLKSSTSRFVGADGGVLSPFPSRVTVCALLRPETLSEKSRARTWNVKVPGGILRSVVVGVPVNG